MTEHASIAAIERHFHAVMRERAGELMDEHDVELPRLTASLVGEAAAAWLPIPGMAGGFAYWLELRATGPVLISESWSRVVGGSGQRHEIRPDGAVLVDQGFV